MKCSVFIATSADGYIATPDGGVDWLETSGNKMADMGDQLDMGMATYLSSIDCMIMGRKCMEKISSFNLTPEQWPYGGIRIIVLSRTVKEPPTNLKDKVEIHAGDIPTLMSQLETEGFPHAYIDGGTTITSFLNLRLIHEITITQAPILLGAGTSLFGKIFKKIKLERAEATAYPNDFIQIKYQVNYQEQGTVGQAV
ncbi:dihydrofolate reductase family protein [Acaryochloris sp. IP29b_bin.137]|uniref:dihydrofolate reductase family protein n=1 Tax=Acaryochloris sp. IP29b_bin.137 TaxID=2969217 RepID=UPI0026109B52|nr:dihydrofolate reductase family protein [Acaryochloris sp. IP29b_bin.137]